MHKRFISYLLSILFILYGTMVGYAQCNVNGGIITTADNTVLCVGDSNDDIVNFNLSGNVGSKSIWLITDERQVILSRLPGQPLNFNAANDGVVLVYHMSFEEDASGFSVGANISEIQGCHDLSNPISIIKNLVEGGSIYDDQFTTTRTICLSSSQDALIDLNLVDEYGDNGSWIITNENDIITELSSSPPFNFSGSNAGVSYIYHIGYNDMEGLEVGNSIASFAGCYSLSNAYKITKVAGNTEGGQINSTSILNICSGDGTPDIIDIDISGTNAGNNILVVTNPQGIITQIEENETSIDLEGRTETSSTIRNINYVSGVKGLLIGADIENIQGCYDFSNAITVSQNYVFGGNLSANGESELHLCVDDGTSDIVNIGLTGNRSINSRIVIVDDLDSIISIGISTNFDFENTGGGTNKIYNISYNEGVEGLKLDANLDDITGCFSLSNPVIVNKYTGVTDAGFISTEDNTFLCTGDSEQDIIEVDIENHGSNESMYIVTNQDGDIVFLSDAPSFDFSNAVGGINFIYHIDYIPGLKNLTMGSNLTDLEGCFDLSNSIQVNKNGVNGGDLVFENGLDSIVLCISQSGNDEFHIESSGIEGSNQIYLLTNADKIIIDSLSSLDIDFESLTGNIFYLYLLSYEDNLTGLAPANTIDALNGCYDLSNPLKLEIQNTLTTPSSITTSDATSVCVGDSQDDIIDIEVFPGVGSRLTYIVTNPPGDILYISNNNKINVENLPGTINYISVITHDVNLQGLETGKNLMDLHGCYSESNRIAIQKNINDGGTLSITETGADTYVACLRSGATNFSVNIEGHTGENSLFIQTSISGSITGLSESPNFNYSDTEPGVSLIWHISYSTGISGLNMDQNINSIQGCYALSNPVTIMAEQIQGGEIITTTGVTELDICGGEGINDLVEVELKDVIGVNRSWIVTSPAGNIISLPTGPVFNFEESPTGVYYLQNLTMGSNFSGLETGANINGLNGCYDLSNRIIIRKTHAEGGELSILGNGSVYNACVSNNEPDFIDFQLSNTSGSSRNFILARTNGEILDLFNTPNLEVNQLAEGLCRVYNISYYGLVDGLEIGANIEDLSGCYNLSNYVSISKKAPNGGTLTDANNQTDINICVGDEEIDMINVRLGNFNGESQRWIITDGSDKIISTGLNPPFSPEVIGDNQIKIYSVAYEDNLIGFSAGNPLEQLMGCYNLSNPLIVNKEKVQAAEMLTSENGATETTMCMDDEIPNLLIMNAQGDIIGDNAHLIVVDTSGVIQDEMEVGNIDFTDYGDGQSLVYQISYANGLLGLEKGKKLVELEGCYDLSNSLKITRVSKGSCTVSTYEIDGSEVEINLHPNPASEKLSIEINGEHAKKWEYSVHIFDASGKSILTRKNIHLDKNTIALDVSLFSKGIYYLKLTTKDHIMGLPFIKN